jgi:hypothetical protein
MGFVIFSSAAFYRDDEQAPIALGREVADKTEDAGNKVERGAKKVSYQVKATGKAVTERTRNVVSRLVSEISLTTS